MDPNLGRLVSVAGSFLILSLVAEKLADFLKLNNMSLRNKKKNHDDEKIRERDIVKRTILVGLIISFFLKADAIQMIVSGEPGEVMGWQNVIFYAENDVIELTGTNYNYYRALHGDDFGATRMIFTWLQLVLGMGISGAALSFGSKFWHDLIGLLYEIKDARSRINSSEFKAETGD